MTTYKIDDDYEAITAYDEYGKAKYFYELRSHRGAADLVDDLTKMKDTIRCLKKGLSKLKESIREYDNGLWPDDIERIIKDSEALIK